MAVIFIFRYTEELGVCTSGYSVWGGSADGRMTAAISSYVVQPFGGAADISKLIRTQGFRTVSVWVSERLPKISSPKPQPFCNERLKTWRSVD